MLYQILAIFALNFCLFSKATELYWTEDGQDHEGVGATASQSKEYPFMVFFTSKKCVPCRCSGSLIATEWVLTSKDCVEKQIDINNCLAIAGTTHQSSHLWDEDTVKFLCLQAATEGDLGLVKVETLDPFPDHIYLIYYYMRSQDTLPAFLEDDDNHVMAAEATTERGAGLGGQLGVVLGFQATNDSSKEMRNATRDKKQTAVYSLWRLVLPLLNGEECKQKISDLFQPRDSVVCSVCDFGSKTTCLMDQGGPLLYRGKLLGVVSGSYSRHCFLRHSLAVYTQVSQYEDWIEKTIRPESKLEPVMRSFNLGLNKLGGFNGGQSCSTTLSSLLQGLVIVILVKSIVLQRDGLV